MVCPWVGQRRSDRTHRVFGGSSPLDPGRLPKSREFWKDGCDPTPSGLSRTVTRRCFTMSAGWVRRSVPSRRRRASVFGLALPRSVAAGRPLQATGLRSRNTGFRSAAGRDGRVVEGARLLSVYTGKTVSRVRIPLSPFGEQPGRADRVAGVPGRGKTEPPALGRRSGRQVSAAAGGLDSTEEDRYLAEAMSRP
jgi:hypothetical protein